MRGQRSGQVSAERGLSTTSAPYPPTPRFQQYFSPPACVAARTGRTIPRLGVVRLNSISIRRVKGRVKSWFVLGVFEPDFDETDM